MQHSIRTMKIAHPHHGDAAIVTNVAVFDTPNDTGSVWINIMKLWDDLHFNFFPWSGAIWFQRQKVRWQSRADELGLGENMFTYSWMVMRNLKTILCMSHPRREAGDSNAHTAHFATSLVWSSFRYHHCFLA